MFKNDIFLEAGVFRTEDIIVWLVGVMSSRVVAIYFIGVWFFHSSCYIWTGS